VSAVVVVVVLVVVVVVVVVVLVTLCVVVCMCCRHVFIVMRSVARALDKDCRSVQCLQY